MAISPVGRLHLLVVLRIWLFATPFVLSFSRPAFVWNNLLHCVHINFRAAAVSQELHAILVAERPPVLTEWAGAS